jgi:hypothetical protein
MNEPGSILYYFLSWKFNMSLVLFCFVINSQKVLGIDIRSQVCYVKNNTNDLSITLETKFADCMIWNASLLSFSLINKMENK